MDEMLLKLLSDVLGGSFTPPPEKEPESSKKNETDREFKSMKSKEETAALEVLKKDMENLLDIHNQNVHNLAKRADDYTDEEMCIYMMYSDFLLQVRDNIGACCSAEKEGLISLKEVVAENKGMSLKDIQKAMVIRRITEGF